MIYHWRYSALFLAATIVSTGVVIVMNSTTGGVIIGSILAAVLDIRFLPALVVGGLLMNIINPALSAAVVAGTFALCLGLTLKDHWEQLGVPDQTFLQLFFPTFLGSPFILSAWHALAGWWKPATKPPERSY